MRRQLHSGAPDEPVTEPRPGAARFHNGRRQRRPGTACGTGSRGGKILRSTSWPKLYGVLRLAAQLAGSTLKRRRRTQDLAARLAAFPQHLPLRDAVEVHWSDRQIPFIEARHDEDLAVALGAVHGHLRIAQIEIMRLIAYGRLSEVLGPVAVELDHSLRVVDFPRAVPQILARAAPETRAWLGGFAAGLNASLDALREQPEEFALFGVTPRRWSTEDVLAISRLAAMDFSWRVWHRLLALRERPDWTDLWKRIVDAQAAPVPSLAGGEGPAALLDQLWAGFGRPGSNAAAISGIRSRSGGALLTSDPHLSILLPNSWLIAGMASPGYHVAGLMIPGLPVVALGRNRHIAWSGTSLHAASSDLFDVTGLPADQIRERRETIRMRWSAPREVTLRETEHGPIITDAPLLRGRASRDLALTWIGHRPSDETAALLGVMRATDWPSFLAAVESFAAPAQNLVYADTAGRVGRTMAAHLPRRPRGYPEDLVMPPEMLSNWNEIVTGRDLPRTFEPAEGFVASANDRPSDETPVPVGFFFSAGERIVRLRAALGGSEQVCLDELRALHRDVRMPSAPAIRELLLERLGPLPPDGDGPAALVGALRRWDGAHEAESEGALAFELFLYHFLHRLHGQDGLALYRGSLQPWELLREDLRMLPAERLSEAARLAATDAAPDFARYSSWGALHRLALSHPLSALPGLGRRYRFSDDPVGGSNETLMKTAHGLSNAPHRVGFGANARFLADLSDPDESYAVLLGGQDGWIGSTTFADQLAPWQAGDYCRLPLRLESVRAEFRHRTPVRPAEELKRAA